MSSITFLVTELQSLASETRRKHSDVREAAEKAITILRNLPDSDQGTSRLSEDGPQSEDLLRPVFMGCATKNTKVIAISLGSLQRLIALQAVPQTAVPAMLSTMNECMSQGVDIQLRILQTLLSLITNFSAIHGLLLGDALLLCFKMQESRIAVVSSTAAATLRQLVMFIIDKVVDEDRRDNLQPNELTEIVLPDGTHKSLGPSAMDAYSIVEDLCLLANSEKPHFLKLGSLPKTFALELIESVLTNYHDLFRQHSELLILLQHHLCPLLLKLMSDKPLFPLTLRSTRVVFILLKQFSSEFMTEAEVFLALLIRIIGGESDAGSNENTSRPQWMRVLAMEIIRGLCNDAELMRRIWERYDCQEGRTKLFGSLVSVLKRLITEKPALLGVSSQMFGVGVSSHSSEVPSSAGAGGYGFDIGTVAGIVANAASATMTNVVGRMGAEYGLDLTGSSMKLQCIDQLDKADVPPIPDAYIYLLGLQCLVSISEGFASLTLPLFNSIVVQRSRAAGEITIKAPPALDITALPPDQSSTQQLRSVHGMIENGWPGLLAALSFLVATNLSDELFGDVLQSYQNLANVAGMLGLSTPRDAFLTSLAKFAIPSRVVSSLDTYIEPPTPRSSTLQEGFNALAGGGPPQPPGLSDRNMACLKVLVASALFLAGSLGLSWYHILEALQNAEYVLTAKGQKPVASKRQSTISPGSFSGNRSVSSPVAGQPIGTTPTQSRHLLLSDVDSDSIQRTIQRLFDSSKNLEDSAFRDFVTSLCRLSAEMVEMQSDAGVSLIEVESAEIVPALSPSISSESAHRRRVSGIHLPRTLRSGDFSINKLGAISRLNILRFTTRPPEVAWTVVTSHLIAVLRNKVAPHPIRLQASRTLDDILLIVPRSIGSSEEHKISVQRLMLDVLAEQIAPDLFSGNTTTIIEIRKMGLETLHQILQSAGHTLLVGWETIFEMLGSVCDPSPSANALASVPETAVSSPTVSPRFSRPPPLNYPTEKGSAVLVRIAFQSLTLVCDSLSTLSPEHLRLCINTIGRFGRQADTNISLTAAGSLLWGVSDSIQTRRKDSEQEEEYNVLWMLLLLEMLGLCTDSRSEVRVGAIQTLFRTLQLYGATLSLETWDECLWKVTFPLLESITVTMKQLSPSMASSEPETTLGMAPDAGQAWDESKTLALQSIGSIFNDFLTSKIVNLESFERVWNTFVSHIQNSFMFDSAASCTAALRCLEKAIKAFNGSTENFAEKVKGAWHRVWMTCDDMGQLVLRRSRPPLPGHITEAASPLSFDQDSLLALVDVIKSTRTLSKKEEGYEWEIEQLNRLMIILKGILTYPDSPSYRPDIDDLTPVQMGVIDAINDIDLTVPGAPSLVLRDLSEILTLPYLGAFEVHGTTTDPSRPMKDPRVSKRVTYIGLTKKVMPMLLETFIRFKDSVVIYTDETVEAIFSAYSVPVKLKHECPAPSKFGNDTPLWKTATTIFLHVVKECTKQLKTFGTDIPDARIEGIWRQIIDVFKGGILADSRVLDSLPQEEQETEEMFGISLIASLEVDVIPYVADSRVSDHVIIQLAKMLHQGSLIYIHEESTTDDRSTGSASGKSASSTAVETVGSTINWTTQSQERFSYWCLDLLFLISSDLIKDEDRMRRRIAALSLPILLNRCRTTLLTYLADEMLRGNYPFPRTREEELVYILKKVHSLHLWPGSLWAALSPSPSTYCVEQPDVEGGLPPSQLFIEATKRSTRAHLFQLYGPICEIAALPHKPPVAWAPAFNNGISEEGYSDGEAYQSREMSLVEINARSKDVEELDARSLASTCLSEIGKELSIF